MKVVSTHQSLAETSADLLVLVTSDDLNELSALPDPLSTHVRAYAQQRSFKGATGRVLLVPTLGALPAPLLLLVGVGGGSTKDVAQAAYRIGREARSASARRVAVFGPTDIESIAIGNYAWEEALPAADRRAALSELALSAAPSEAEVNAALVRAEAHALARDLVNLPPAELYPETLAQAARALESDAVRVEVKDLATLQAQGYVGIVAVGQGSDRPPCQVHAQWRPDQAVAHVALVGKGVTFDSGGLCLKPPGGMQTMRCDMAGAATMLAVFKAAVALKLPINLDLFLGCAENLIDGRSYKLGDILRYRNGVTVEIHNTDAEGRLVLADCLIDACNVEGVQVVIDAATLTGACVVALGPDFSGLFTDDERLASELTQAGQETQEAFWRLPLHAPYKEMFKGDWAQIRNVGGRDAGATTAALFLQHFVQGKRWAHLDIAGPAFHEKNTGRYHAGASGEPVRAVLRWLENLAAAAANG